MLKGDNILIIEEQLNILEKESKLLEESYNKKNNKAFNNSKKKMINAQEKIKELVK